LGKRARRILQEVEQGRHSIIVPIIVLEETARLIEKKVVRLAVPFRRRAEELDRSANFQVEPYTIEILLEYLLRWLLSAIPQTEQSSPRRDTCVVRSSRLMM
jgi:predicted nucleic acid-binding protein